MLRDEGWMLRVVIVGKALGWADISYPVVRHVIPRLTIRAEQIRGGGRPVAPTLGGGAQVEGKWGIGCVRHSTLRVGR